MLRWSRLGFAILLATIMMMPRASKAQGITIGAGDAGLAIGNAARTDGVRLNFRDRGLGYVNGVNLTVWTPHQPAAGVVSGVALGIPATGAAVIRGFSLGVLGVEAETSISGVGIGGLGLGAGRELTGVFVGGLGVGAGEDLTGIFLGGLGAGAGGSVRGLVVGGLGAGAGGDLQGIVISGLGAGAGRDVTGFLLAGLGAGAGQSFEGVGVAGLGVGAGGNVRGILISGIGAGAGGTLEGLAVAGLAAGAPTVRGAIVAPIGGGEHVTGLLVTPAYARIEPGGAMRGFSLSAFNHMRGEVHGLTIGILNYARSLHGIQIGLLNFAGNNRRGLRWLPIANAHFD